MPKFPPRPVAPPHKETFFANRVRWGTYCVRRAAAPALFGYHVTRCKRSRKTYLYANL